MPDESRKLRATTLSQIIQDCGMVVKFAFNRKDGASYPPNAGSQDYDEMIRALSHIEQSSLKYFEGELDRFSAALVNQGDNSIGIVYAIPLLNLNGKEVAQALVMREQETGPIFWAAVKEWVAEKIVKSVGNTLTKAFLYWVEGNHPTLTISHIEIRASYLDDQAPNDGRRSRYNDVITIPFQYADILSYSSVGNNLVAFLIRVSAHVEQHQSWASMQLAQPQCFQALHPLKYGIQ